MFIILLTEVKYKNSLESYIFEKFFSFLPLTNYWMDFRK